MIKIDFWFTCIALTSTAFAGCSATGTFNSEGRSVPVSAEMPGSAAGNSLSSEVRYSHDDSVAMVVTALTGQDTVQHTLAHQSDNWRAVIQRYHAEPAKKFGVAGRSLRWVPVERFVQRVKSGHDACGLLDDASGSVTAVIGSIVYDGSTHLQTLNPARQCNLLRVDKLQRSGVKGVWVATRRGGIRMRFGSSEVEVDKLWHNFAVTKPNQKLKAAFRIRNLGQRNIVLGAVHVSCGCLDVTDTSELILAPGISQEIQATVTTGRGTSFFHTLDIALFQQGTEHSRRITFCVYGNQYDHMKVTPESIDFGVIRSTSKSPSRKVRLSEVPTDRFEIQSVDVAGLPLQYTVQPSSRPDGMNDYIIALALTASQLVEGDSSGKIVIRTTSAQFPRVVVPVSWRVPRAVRAVPAGIAFGTVQLGQTVVRQVEIVCDRRAENARLQVMSQPDDCRIVAHEEDSRRMLEIHFTPGKIGIVQSPLVLRIDDGQLDHKLSVDCVALVLSPSRKTNGGIP